MTGQSDYPRTPEDTPGHLFCDARLVHLRERAHPCVNVLLDRALLQYIQLVELLTTTNLVNTLFQWCRRKIPFNALNAWLKIQQTSVWNICLFYPESRFWHYIINYFTYTVIKAHSRCQSRLVGAANLHYKNVPIQIYEKLTSKTWKLSDKKKFHTSAQNIACEYSLEPPQRVPQPMFLSKNRKINVYPCKPEFYFIKARFKGKAFFHSTGKPPSLY